MPRFDQEEFNRFVLQHDVVGFFEEPITLKSGRESNWYVNWRGPTSDVLKTHYLAGQVIAFAKGLGLEPETFYGVPEGATKLGVIAQYMLGVGTGGPMPCAAKAHTLAMGRAKPKGHGDPRDKFFLGLPQGRTVVLEDVTTTGGSLLEELLKLRSAGVDVVAAIGLTNRMELRDDRQSVQQAVESMGVPYHHMSNALDLLPQAYAAVNPGESIGRAIEAEFEQFGVEKLRLVGA